MLMGEYPMLPVREKSANGFPPPKSEYARVCGICGADFMALVKGADGMTGMWRNWQWVCSRECAERLREREQDEEERSG